MPAKFTVIRYVPDPIAAEQINIGVVAFDADRVRARFIADWRRVRDFGGEDPAFLRDFAKSFDADTREPTGALFEPPAARLSGTTIESFAQRWNHCVQMSEPRASLKSVDEVLDEASSRFLRLRHEPLGRGRYARREVRQLHATIRKVLVRVAPERADHLLKRDDEAEIKGALRPHRFDVVVRNGHPLIAAHALSFDQAKLLEMEHAADALAWAIKDINDRAATQRPAIGVWMTPPAADRTDGDRRSELYGAMQRVYRKLDATVFDGTTAERWAERHLRSQLNAGS